MWSIGKSWSFFSYKHHIKKFHFRGEKLEIAILIVFPLPPLIKIRRKSLNFSSPKKVKEMHQEVTMEQKN